MTDLVAYHQFVLECAESGLSDQQFTWLLTDIIYMHLFGMDANGLRAYFGLPADASDDAIRDCMGVEVLVILPCMELRCIWALKGLQGLTQIQVIEIVWEVVEAEVERLGLGIIPPGKSHPYKYLN